ncbi:MAG: glycosyltransferase family protein [Parvibaculales bacterium]
MRILFVGNFHEKQHGAYFYVMSRKLANGFIRNGHQVYQFSDRDIARASSPIHSRNLGKGAANKSLIRHCTNYLPELIVLSFADIIAPKTLAAIRDMLPDTPIVNSFIDAMEGERNEGRIRSIAPYVSAHFVTGKGELFDRLVKEGMKLYYVPNAVDSSVETLRQFEKKSTPCDVFFSVGSEKGDRERCRQALELAEKLPELAFSYHGFAGKPPIWGMEYYEGLSQSTIGLNFSRNPSLPLYSSDRIAQYMGNGLLSCIHRRFQLEKLFGEERAIFYENSDELAEKIAFFVKNPAERQKAARAAYEFVHEHHNGQKIAQFIEEISFSKPLSQNYLWQGIK